MLSILQKNYKHIVAWNSIYSRLPIFC